MQNEWRDIVITKIVGAYYVMPYTGKHIHKNRPFHGLVLNGSGCIRDYCFSDGKVLHADEGNLFYLPKGSSYEVKSIHEGGCYAINFDAQIKDEPFTIKLQNAEQVKKIFKRACDEWSSGRTAQNAFAMGALYEAIGMFLKERESAYLPSGKYRLIEPALEKIKTDFLDPRMSVEALAEICGVSEVYLRKLFISRFGISPKEYIIRKRIDYACRLLSSGQFEVHTVAEMCGYSEPCHFSREFKKRIGIAPKNYC